MQMILHDGEIQILLKALKRTKDEGLKSVYNRVVAMAQGEEDRAEDYAKYRQAAKDTYQAEGITEIDDDAVISEGNDPGAYVMAWVWVAAGDAGVDHDEESEETNEQ